MIPLITLQDLADFLMSLPDNEPINMASGHKNDPSGGCLMTKFGVSKGWKFDDCYAQRGWITNRGVLIATIEASVFNLFKVFETVHVMDCEHVKPWKDHLKEEYHNHEN